VRNADNLPPSCAVVMKSRNLKFLEPSGPVQACNGHALPLNSLSWLKKIISHYLVAEDRIRFQVNPCGFCGGQSGSGPGFLCQHFVPFSVSIISRWLILVLDVCGTVHHLKNDASNQQDATNSVYWSFLNQLYMFRATNSSVIRSTFWVYIQYLVQCTD